MRRDITYKSADNFTDIHACIWEPTGPVKAIIQISHGMVEHIKRYENFAEEMINKGILICGNDHLGHGNSVIDKEHYGYFAASNSANILIDDVYSLTKIMQEQYPNTPYFVLGHSMGSFIIRNYIAKYNKSIDGAIIVGTGYQSSLKMTLAKILTIIIKIYHQSWFYRSKYLENISTGKYYKYFANNQNKHCWLTKDNNVLMSYEKDPFCNFRFTCNGYHTLFSLIKLTNKTKKNINKDLPILLLSGKDDPVGNFGKDIIKIYNSYKNLGIKDVKMKLYNNMRHEILNEIEKPLIYNEIIQFVNSKSLNLKRDS